MGIKAYGEDGNKALRIARETERALRGMTPQKLHDRVVKAVQDAGFGLELSILAAWEAISE